MKTLVLINGKELKETAKVAAIAGKFYHAKVIKIDFKSVTLEKEDTIVPSFSEKDIKELGKGNFPKYIKIITQYSGYFGWSNNSAYEVNYEEYSSYIENEYEGCPHGGSSYSIFKVNSFKELEDLLSSYEDELYFQNGNESYEDIISIKVLFKNGTEKEYFYKYSYDHHFGSYKEI